jgi:LysR family hydrogen peroxide-inducible transcriptional activator
VASIVQLQYAVELARQKNFMRAAKKCYVTQPTLSMQIQKLEDEYETTLFDRSRKPIELTTAGKKLVDQFQIVLKEYDRIEQLANEERGIIAGNYRLAVIPTIAPHLLPAVLCRFQKKHPGVTITAFEMTTEEIIHGLKETKLDAGILATPLGDPMIHETKLFLEPLYLFHSPTLNFDLDKAGNVAIDKLPMEKLLVLTEGNCLRTQVLDFCRLKEDMRDHQGFDIEASSLLTLMNLVREGDSFTVIPHMAMLTLSAAEQKNQIKHFAKQSPAREVGFVTHRTQVKATIDLAALELLAQIVPKSMPTLTKSVVISPI